jgi:hypothetical protein
MKYVNKASAILLSSTLAFASLLPLSADAVVNNSEFGNVTDYGLTASSCVGSSATLVLVSNTNCVQTVTAGTNISITGTAANPIVNDTNGTVLTTAPTVQRFTSGTGTYTTPANVKWIKILDVGAGGGGGGSGTTTTGGTGGTGGSSTFGTALITAAGGVGGADIAAGTTGGAGGAPTVAAGPLIILSISGGQGGAGWNLSGIGSTNPGKGGVGCRGGSGEALNTYPTAGGAGVTNTGGGGSGSNYLTAISGMGGGAGACVEAIIDAPAATYAYAVGAAGTGGTAGTGGAAGGAGGSGVVSVEEHYNY